jgi:predicted secreted protein
MTTEAAIGYGRLLAINDTSQSPAAYVVVGEITALNGPAFAADAIEATHMQSAARFREFVAGLRDAGEISGEINYTPGNAGMDLLLEHLGEVAQYRITEPSSFSPEATLVSQAILTQFDITGPVAEKMGASFTLKLTGQPTITGVTF